MEAGEPVRGVLLSLHGSMVAEGEVLLRCCGNAVAATAHELHAALAVELSCVNNRVVVTP